MKPVVVALALCAALVAASATTSGRPHAGGNAVAVCGAMFGEAVDASLHLFEVNRFYVLQVETDGRGRATRIEVVPKHWFAETHPEWEGLADYDELTEQEVDQLLARLEEVRPKGRFIRTPDEFSFVTNCVAPIRSLYE